MKCVTIKQGDRHMKRLAWIVCLCFVLIGCTQQKEPAQLSDLTMLTIEQVEEKIEAKESFTVYFGWTQRCGDSLHFQDNYLYEHMEKYEAFKDLFVVNLDEEMPDALEHKEQRSVLMDKFGVSTSPSFVTYENGEVKEVLSWAPGITDDKTGIPDFMLDEFFEKSGFMK